jgi:peroxiredoxin Q/BCP
VEVLGVSFDSVADNAAFARKYDFPFPLLCDTTRELGLAYGACDNAQAGYARRISYLIDENATILKAYDSVSPRSHPAEILADLEK